MFSIEKLLTLPADMLGASGPYWAGFAWAYFAAHVALIAIWYRAAGRADKEIKTTPPNAGYGAASMGLIMWSAINLHLFT